MNVRKRESKEARVEMRVCVRGLGFRACGEARACFVCVCFGLTRMGRV